MVRAQGTGKCVTRHGNKNTWGKGGRKREKGRQ